MLRDVNKLYSNIAKDITTNTAHLKCEVCGKIIMLNQSGVANRLTNGWEKCCGYTMRYYKE